jgi:hypothetical protein
MVQVTFGAKAPAAWRFDAYVGLWTHLVPKLCVQSGFVINRRQVTAAQRPPPNGYITHPRGIVSFHGSERG